MSKNNIVIKYFLLRVKAQEFIASIVTIPGPVTHILYADTVRPLLAFEFC